MSPARPLTATDAVARLATLGITLPAEAIELEQRDGRWAGWLPNGQMVWFATTDAGRARMAVERRILRVLEQRCRFATPRLVAESADGTVDVRAMVRGDHDAFAVFHRLQNDPAGARTVGAALGQMLADLHTNVPASDVEHWIPHHPEWPESRAVIAARLPRVIDDPALHAAADSIIATYEDAVQSTPIADRVLAHADLGLHDVVIDPTTFLVSGIFDWESARWTDRHVDFRYLAFDVDRLELLDAAIESYTLATGVEISRERVTLYNAAAAIGFLSFRDGIAPTTRWCGRTLDEDLAWTRWAVGRVHRQ